MNRVLFAEENLRIGQAVADYLRPFSFTTRIASNCDQTLFFFKSFQPDIVVVNQHLPTGCALEICRQIRRIGDTPILIVGRGDEPFESVCGLEVGADGYVAGPLEPRVLLAWVRALLRRAAGKVHPKAGEDIVYGNLRIVPTQHAAYWHDKRLRITPRHFELLLILARSAGQVVSREQIVREMRGLPFDCFDRSVDMAVFRLRKCVGDAASEPRKIRTERGRGYVLCPQSWD